jgi:hypothetical protein
MSQKKPWQSSSPRCLLAAAVLFVAAVFLAVTKVQFVQSQSGKRFRTAGLTLQPESKNTELPNPTATSILTSKSSRWL